MLLTDEQVEARLTSPLNLLNRLRNASKSNERTTSPLIPFRQPDSKSSAQILCMPAKQVSVDEIVDNLEEKIMAAKTSRQANEILSFALDELRQRLPEVSRPEKLSTIANDMGKIISGLKENNRDLNANHPNVVVYAPSITQENHYDTIVLNE